MFLTQNKNDRAERHALKSRLWFVLTQNKNDRAERHDLKSRLWLFFSPFLFPPKIREKKKRRMNSKNRDFKSCLSARS